jgi:hypothetical protein
MIPAIKSFEGNAISQSNKPERNNTDQPLSVRGRRGKNALSFFFGTLKVTICEEF